MSDSMSGTILTTMATSAVALITLLISKEQKISDLRQTWIDSLRADLANLIAHAMSFRSAQDAGAKWQDYKSEMFGVNLASTTAKLRLNPNEEPSKTLLRLLNEHAELFQEDKPVPTMATLEKVEKELLATAQEVLKKEWERVKAGEPRFRAAIYLALIALIFASASLFWQSQWFQIIIHHKSK